MWFDACEFYGQTAAARGLAARTPDELLAVPDAVAKVERDAVVNLRDLASYEMPKKILLIRDDFTIERGELTPTLKVKRRVVEQEYQEMIGRAYEE